MCETLIKFFDLEKDVEFEALDEAKFKEADIGCKNAMLLEQASKVFADFKPGLIFVQGDTLTTLSYATTAFYNKIPVAYVESGLRTPTIDKPFPEEFNRRVLSQIATLNFTPNARALQNLEAEKILFHKSSYNFNTGNTIIDTLNTVLQKIEDESFDWSKLDKIKTTFEQKDFSLDDYLQKNRRTVLVTAHRRENQEGAIKNLSKAIIELANKYSDLSFLVVTHPNPIAKKEFEYLYQEIKTLNNIDIIEPVEYPIFLKIMIISYLIITDSGGVQEEAPYLNKPVLVFRSETERKAGLELGLAKVVGTSKDSLIEAFEEIHNDPVIYDSMMKNDLQPYGDGNASKRIVEVVLLYIKNHLLNY